MAKPSDGTCCEKCGKRLDFREGRYVFSGGTRYICFDCLLDSPEHERRSPPMRYCTQCRAGIWRGDPHTVRHEPELSPRQPIVLCCRCVEWYDRAGTHTTTGTTAPTDAEPCPTDTCGICETDCGDDEECGEIRNGDRVVHVCGKCFDVWEYIRDMAAEGTGHVGGSPAVTHANEPPPQRPQELSEREKRIGKLADDAIQGSGEK